MGDFTGDYYKCTDCGYIYDYNDLCPNCGGSEIEDLNANEVNEYTNDCLENAKRLRNMLQLHGDYTTNEPKQLKYDVVGRSEQLVCSCGSKLVKTTGGYHCGNAKCSV